MENLPEESPRLIVPEYATHYKNIVDDPTLPQAAGLCGAIPIALELIIFMCWLPTRAEGFAMAEIVAIAFGAFFVGVGALFLLAHIGLMSGPGKLRRFLSTSWVAMLLLFMNFPSAVCVIWVGTR